MSDYVAALRTLRRSPGFTLVAVFTVAVGIAANTTLFSMYDRLVLNPVTLPDPGSLVAILNHNPQLPAPVPAISWPRYEEIRDHARSFDSTAISAFDGFALTGGGGEPEQLTALRISASFLPTLGVAPVRGRNVTADEDVPNGPRVCLLSYELWQSRFGGRDSIVGERILLNGEPWQVVGITPPQLSPPYRQTQLFVPRVFEVGGLTAAQVQAGAGYAQAIARLKRGVSIEQAAQELAAISQGSRERAPGRLDARNTSQPQWFITQLVGTIRPTFHALLGAVGFVLLIACANVASLFLGRLVSRRKEIAVQQSLGASRGRIVRRLVGESLALSLTAGAIGTLLSVAALSAITSLLSAQLPPNTTIGVSWRALVFSAVVSVLAALLVGLVPALFASRGDAIEALKDAARGTSSQHAGRLRAALIVGEVALSVVLLVGASLLLVSFIRLQQTPPGFDPQGAAAAFVTVPTTRYTTPQQQAEFYAAVIARLREQPQVIGAAAAIGMPLTGFAPRSPYSVAGQPILPLPQRALAGLAIVSEDYFAAMGIRFVEGRTFTAADRTGTPGVCIVNHSLARRLFAEQSALGKVLLRGPNADVACEIVGVIHDVKTLGLNVPAPDEIYYPMRQLGRPTMTVMARTTGDPNGLQAVLRAAVAGVDKDQPISFFATFDTNLAQSLGIQRIVASFTAVFAAVALALSVVGLYSVLAYAVSRRRNEIGLRMALGARAGQVIRLVLNSGLRLVLIGLAIGLVAAGAAARLIQSLLFSVQPLDPIVYAGVAIVFAIVGTCACLVPSIRASRIDPLVALRPE
jgi:predicted permease